MSTVPKLNYAKVGKGSKTKVQNASSQLLRSKQEKANDIFSHMNQQNLNYIKKQLKLKKNRSENQRPRSPEHNGTERAHEVDEEVTQRYKLYQKYRGEEQVSEKDPHLQDTQRRTEEENRVNIVLPEDLEEDYDPSDNQNQKNLNQEKQFLSSTHQGLVTRKPAERVQTGQNKMYQSLPYEDAKKRISSIQGYFGQAISTNLNRQEGLFIQFLEEYISDLNHSKNLKSRQNEEPSIEKHRNEGYLSQRKRTVSRQGSQGKYKTNIEDQIRENRKKLDRLKRNSDTFGQHNSKFTMKSQHSSQIEHKEMSHFEQKLKQQKMNSLLLAQQIEKQRQLLIVKDDIIKKLETDNDLLKQEIRHVKMQQEIINKGKKSMPHLQYSHNYRQAYKTHKINNNENELKMFDGISSIPFHHNGTNQNHKTAYSYRSNKQDDDDMFHLGRNTFKSGPVSREKIIKKENDSLEKWKKQYNQFLAEEKNFRYLKGNKEARERLI